MSSRVSTAAAIVAWLSFVGAANAQIVGNGGFETGGFTTWTVGGDTRDVNVWNAAQAGATLVDQGGPFAGTYAAYMGPPAIGTLSQTVSVANGEAYVFSFVLANFPCQPGKCAPGGNSFSALIDGAPVLALNNAPASDYTEYSFAFVATANTATIQFQYSNFPAFFSIDEVAIVPAPGPPCVYSLKSGAATTYIEYCISANGTVVKLQAPAGQEHVDIGQVLEGYVICSGTNVHDWDLSDTASGFGATTILKGPTATSVTLRRSSDRYQLDQILTLAKKEKELTITMTVTNISGAMIPDVRIARAYDPDINHDFGDDLEVTSARGVWAGDVDAVTLTATAWSFPTDTAIDTGPAPACSPTGSASPATTGDASLAGVTYRAGNMGAGAKKRVTFVYRVQ